MPAKGRTDRRAPDHPVLVQVAARQAAAARADVRDDGAPELAAVQRAGAVPRDRLERVGEAGQAEAVAAHETVPLTAVRLRAFGGVAEDRVEDRVQVRLRARELDPVAGELDRGREQLRPGELSAGAVRYLEAERRSGDGDGGGADPEDLRARAVEGDVDLLHRRPLGATAAKSGDGDEEVQQPGDAVAGAVDEDEAAAARP